MADDNNPKKRNPFDDFPKEFPNDFFKNIQKIIEEMLKNSDFSDIEKFFENGLNSGAGSNNPFVWGFSFNKGADGKPRFEQFGDFIKKMGFNNGGVEVNGDDERIREPLADIIEEDSEVRVIIEMPGVDKSQIDISTTERVLKLKSNSENRTYKKEIKLPVSVIPESSKAKFNNGVLEITLQRVTPENSKKISID